MGQKDKDEDRFAEHNIDAIIGEFEKEELEDDEGLDEEIDNEEEIEIPQPKKGDKQGKKQKQLAPLKQQNNAVTKKIKKDLNNQKPQNGHTKPQKKVETQIKKKK